MSVFLPSNRQLSGHRAENAFYQNLVDAFIIDILNLEFPCFCIISVPMVGQIFVLVKNDDFHEIRYKSISSSFFFNTNSHKTFEIMWTLIYYIVLMIKSKRWKVEACLPDSTGTRFSKVIESPKCVHNHSNYVKNIKFSNVVKNWTPKFAPRIQLYLLYFRSSCFFD